MKKLLSLLTAILVTSSATTAVTGFAKASQASNELNNEANDINGQTKWSDSGMKDQQDNGDIKLRYDTNRNNFKVDKDNNITQNGFDISFRFNWTGGNINLVNFNSVEWDIDSNQDTKDYAKFFDTELQGHDWAGGYQNYTIKLKDNNLDQMPKMDADLTLKLKVHYKKLFKDRTYTYDLPIHVKKESESVVVKQQLNSYIGTNVIKLGKINTEVGSSDEKAFLEDVTKSINLAYPKIANQWEFQDKPSLTSRSGKIKMLDKIPNVGGSVLFTYELSSPKPSIEEGAEINLGIIPGLDKYNSTKNSMYQNYSKLYKALGTWWTENHPDTYKSQYNFVSPKNAFKLNPFGDSITFTQKNPNPAIKGDFTVSYNIAYTDIKSVVNEDLGTIKGINTFSTKKEVEDAIKAKLNEKYKDFKDEFDVEVHPNNDGTFSTNNEVTVIMKNVEDNKQFIQAGTSTTIKFNLEAQSVNNVITENTVNWNNISAPKFLDSNESISDKILNQIINSHPGLAGKVEVSLGDIDWTDPTTWTATIKAKDDANITGEKTISFDVSAISIDDIVKSNEFNIKDKFLLATSAEVQKSIVDAFNKEYEDYTNLLTLDLTSMNNFDAKDPSTWNFKMMANSSISKYINGESEQSFKLSQVSVSEVLGSEQINLTGVLDQPAINPDKKKLAEEIENMLFGNTKARKYAKLVGADLQAHPELKGMVKVVVDDNAMTDQIHGGALIQVDSSNAIAKEYLTGEVKVGYTLSQVDITEIITSKDINDMFEGQLVSENTNEKIEAKLGALVVKNSNGTLTKDDVKLDYSIDKKGNLSVSITVNDGLAYTGTVKGVAKLETTINLDDLLTDEDITATGITFAQLISTNQSTINDVKEGLAESILVAHMTDSNPISMNDFEVTDYTFDPNDLDAGAHVTVKATTASSKFTGTKVLNTKITSSPIGPFFDNNISDFQNIEATIFDNESSMNEKTMAKIKAYLPDLAPYVKVISTKTGSKWDVKVVAKDETIAKYLTGEYNIDQKDTKVITMPSVFIQNDTDSSATIVIGDYGNKINAISSEQDIIKTILPSLKDKVIDMYKSSINNIPDGFENTFFDSLVVKLKNADGKKVFHKDSRSKASGIINITAGGGYEQFIKGDLNVSFSFDYQNVDSFDKLFPDQNTSIDGSEFGVTFFKLVGTSGNGTLTQSTVDSISDFINRRYQGIVDLPKFSFKPMSVKNSDRIENINNMSVQIIIRKWGKTGFLTHGWVDSGKRMIVKVQKSELKEHFSPSEKDGSYLWKLIDNGDMIDNNNKHLPDDIVIKNLMKDLSYKYGNDSTVWVAGIPAEKFINEFNNYFEIKDLKWDDENQRVHFTLRVKVENNHYVTGSSVKVSVEYYNR